MEFNNPIIGEEELIRSAIRSQDYVTDASGWRIAADGTAEFSDIVIRGNDTGDILVAGPDTAPQVIIRAQSGIAHMRFPTNSDTAPEVIPAIISTITSQKGTAAEQAVFSLIGAELANSVTDERVALAILSEAEDETNPAQMNFVHQNGFITDIYMLILNKTAATFGVPVEAPDTFQAGSEDITFVGQISFTMPVVFDTPFAVPPAVSTNINSGSGVTARWYSRAFAITETGFTLFVAKGDAADPAQNWTNIPVTWQAKSITQ